MIHFCLHHTIAHLLALNSNKLVSRIAVSSLILTLLLSAGTSVALAQNEPAAVPPASSLVVAPLPWELRPYQVQIEVSFAPSQFMSTETRHECLLELDKLLQARYGRMWNLSISTSTAWISPDTLLQMSDEAAARRWSPHPFDKVFHLLADLPPDGSLLLSGREWDRSSQSLSAMQQRELPERRDVAADLAGLVSSLFRPVVSIDQIEGRKASARIRAGEFPVPDDADQPIKVGSHLVPFLRFEDKTKPLGRIQTIPWTYLEITGEDRARVEMQLHSSFRSPLPAPRRRIQVLALLVRPAWPATEILIYPRGNRQNVLVGTRCEYGDDSPPTAQAPPSETESDTITTAAHAPQFLETDRRGIVTIPATATQKLQTLRIYSGEALLARVPVLPGTVPRMELEVPDDRARLNIEGEVHLLEGELTEIVATREVLITRTNAAVDQKRWSDVDKFLRDLQHLPSQSQFVRQIDRLELQAVQAAKRAGDRVAEARIERLCTSIRESAQKYLEPTRISEFVLQINSQRQKDEAKGAEKAVPRSQ